MILERGQILAEGRYEVDSYIAAGGMAEVWRVKHIPSGGIHAIKIMNMQSLEHPEMLERFALEYELVSRLKHPHIIKVYEYGHYAKDSRLLPWFTMDYFPQTLRQRMRLISVGEGLKLILPILDALHYAHSQNICHRDLKPMNILIDQAGRAVLSDFGIAKETDRDRQLTGRNIIGTAYYISPEQAMGMKVTPRSDIYAMGVMLYQLVTGQFPFEADSEINVIRKHIKESPRRVTEINPGISDKLAQLIERCLAKKPEDRFRNCLEMGRALRECNELGETVHRVLTPGQMLMDGRYTVLRLIDQGGFAEVYRVRHASRPGSFALKIMLPALAYDQEMMHRFNREIQLMSLLNHPNIVKVVDSGLHSYENLSLPWFVMPYIPGNLQQCLNEPIDHEKALTLIQDVLKALDYAHTFEKGNILHRDLKPSNILIDTRGKGYLTDFGIARFNRDLNELKAMTATMTRSAIGTSYYMSPEQIKNEDLDSRSDLYAVGIILYELVTGRKPFEARSSEQIIAMHLYEEALAPRQLNPMVSPRLNEVILKCLHKDRTRRFGSIAELLEALESAKYKGRWFPEGGPMPGPITRLSRPIVSAQKSAFAALKRPQTWAGIAACIAAGVMVFAGGAVALRNTGYAAAMQTHGAQALTWRGGLAPAQRLSAQRQNSPSAIESGMIPTGVAFLDAKRQTQFNRLHEAHAAAEGIDANRATALERRMQTLLTAAQPRLRLADADDTFFLTDKPNAGDVRLLLQLTGQRPDLPPFDYEYRLAALGSTDSPRKAVIQGQPLAIRDIPFGEYQIDITGVYKDFRTNTVRTGLVVQNRTSALQVELRGQGTARQLVLAGPDPSALARYEWIVRDREDETKEKSFPAGPLGLADLAEGRYEVFARGWSDASSGADRRSPTLDILVDRTAPTLAATRLTPTGSTPLEGAQRFALMQNDAEIFVQLSASDNLTPAGQVGLWQQLDEHPPARLEDRNLQLAWNPDVRAVKIYAQDESGLRSEPLTLNVLSVDAELSAVLARLQDLYRKAAAEPATFARTETWLATADTPLFDAAGELNREALIAQAGNASIREDLAALGNTLDDSIAADSDFAAKAAWLENLATTGLYTDAQRAGIRDGVTSARARWLESTERVPRPNTMLEPATAALFSAIDASDIQYTRDDTGTLPRFDLTLPLLPMENAGFKVAMDQSGTGEAELKRALDRAEMLVRSGGHVTVPDPFSPVAIALQPYLEPGEGPFERLEGERFFVAKAMPAIPIPAETRQLLETYPAMLETLAGESATYARTRAWVASDERIALVRDGRLDRDALLRQFAGDASLNAAASQAATLKQMMAEDREFAAALPSLGERMTGWREDARSGAVEAVRRGWIEAAQGPVGDVGQRLRDLLRLYAMEREMNVLVAPKVDKDTFTLERGNRIGIAIPRASVTGPAGLTLEAGFQSQADDKAPLVVMAAPFDEKGIAVVNPPAPSDRVTREYAMQLRWVDRDEQAGMKFVSPWVDAGQDYRHLLSQVSVQAVQTPLATVTPTPVPGGVIEVTPEPTASPTPEPTPPPANYIGDAGARSFVRSLGELLSSQSGRLDPAKLVSGYKSMLVSGASSHLLGQLESSAWQSALKDGTMELIGATIIRRHEESPDTFVVMVSYRESGARKQFLLEMILKRDGATTKAAGDTLRTSQ